ncbi:MAG: hypothetical protein PWP34_2595, partial [Desulfuromonadales bacterium]|nr:hypothetical protein [Desulfuromonadales bacterium]
RQAVSFSFGYQVRSPADKALFQKKCVEAEFLRKQRAKLREFFVVGGNALGDKQACRLGLRHEQGSFVAVLTMHILF